MGAKIYNSNLTKAIIDGAKLQVQDGNIPSEIGNTVVPVMEVNPNLLKINNYIKSSSRTNAGTVTIGTTETTKETYLTGAWIALVKDALNDTSTSTIAVRVTINGSMKDILGVSSLTLTAQNSVNSITFKNPIKIDKNTAITTSSILSGAGNIILSAGVNGYQLDNINS